MDRRNKTALFVCFVILIIAVLLGLGFGSVRINPFGNAAAKRIMLYVRLPRVIAAALCGTALAVSGVIIQKVLNNPLASPGILGVNSGAGLFTVLCYALFPSAVAALPFAAFVGALATVLAVYAIAKKAGASKITLILSGVAVSSLATAGIHTVTSFNPDILRRFGSFQTGGFAGVVTKSLIPAGALIIVGVAAAIILSGELEILGLGEETALSLGLNVPLYRFVFLVTAAVLAGAAVSFAGLISFVGLIIPHIARLLTSGARFRVTVSAVAGAAFLILCDLASRIAFAPFELPVGILASFLGAPFFLYLLLRERRRRGG